MKDTIQLDTRRKVYFYTPNKKGLVPKINDGLQTMANIIRPGLNVVTL